MFGHGTIGNPGFVGHRRDGRCGCRPTTCPAPLRVMGASGSTPDKPRKVPTHNTRPARPVHGDRARSRARIHGIPLFRANIVRPRVPFIALNLGGGESTNADR